MCGLYFADRQRFDAALPRFRRDGRFVLYAFGCMGGEPIRVATIVEKEGPVIRVRRDYPAPPTFHSEMMGRPDHLDIAHGGWPEYFRTAGEAMDYTGEVQPVYPKSQGGLYSDEDARETEGETSDDDPVGLFGGKQAR